MKTATTLIVILLSIGFGFSQQQNSKITPLDIVNKRMDYYNKHDFSEFIKLYANDVKIYTYPDKLLGTGIGNLTSIFAPKFTAKSIKVKIVSQINNGNYVINHEVVTEKGLETKYVSIYEVKEGLIKSVFDWDLKQEGNSAIIDTGVKDVISGHINKLGLNESKNYVTLYIGTDSLNLDLDTIKFNGGRILVHPIKFPDNRTFTWFEDIVGNTIGVITPFSKK